MVLMYCPYLLFQKLCTPFDAKSLHPRSSLTWRSKLSYKHGISIRPPGSMLINYPWAPIRIRTRGPSGPPRKSEDPGCKNYAEALHRCPKSQMNRRILQIMAVGPYGQRCRILPISSSLGPLLQLLPTGSLQVGTLQVLCCSNSWLKPGVAESMPESCNGAGLLPVLGG